MTATQLQKEHYKTLTDKMLNDPKCQDFKESMAYKHYLAVRYKNAFDKWQGLNFFYESYLLLQAKKLNLK